MQRVNVYFYPEVYPEVNELEVSSIPISRRALNIFVFIRETADDWRDPDWNVLK